MPVQLARAPTQDGNIGEQLFLARRRQSDEETLRAHRNGDSPVKRAIQAMRWMDVRLSSGARASQKSCNRCLATRSVSDGRKEEAFSARGSYTRPTK